MNAPAGSRGRGLLSWILLALGVAYAALLHHGLGPRPTSGLEWYSPRGFLTQAVGDLDWAAAAVEDLGFGVMLFWPPALLLAALCWWTTRSSLLRAASASVAAASGIFLFYALASGVTRFAWNFFHWRASGTMLALAAVWGTALTAPWLGARWLRLGWPARGLSFLLVTLLVVAVERNVTGTDHGLRFAISPWPAVQVIGLETVATLLAALAAGTSLGLLGLARLRGGTGAADRALGALALGVGAALPAGWLWLGSYGLLPFRASAAQVTLATAVCLLSIGASAIVGIRLRPHGLRYRGVTFGTGALLLAVPLFLGQVWARWDYTRTRDGSAQQVLDALQSYYDRETVYPDDLMVLVDTGDLERVPEPHIGFALLGAEREFVYQAFGTSYLLEFAAPRWVQCAYNPPYDEEEWEEEEGDEDGEDDSLGGSWSCPSTPPELW